MIGHLDTFFFLFYSNSVTWETSSHALAVFSSVKWFSCLKVCSPHTYRWWENAELPKAFQASWSQLLSGLRLHHYCFHYGNISNPEICISSWRLPNSTVFILILYSHPLVKSQDGNLEVACPQVEQGLVSEAWLLFSWCRANHRALSELSHMESFPGLYLSFSQPPVLDLSPSMTLQEAVPFWFPISY